MKSSSINDNSVDEEELEEKKNDQNNANNEVEETDDKKDKVIALLENQIINCKNSDQMIEIKEDLFTIPTTQKKEKEKDPFPIRLLGLNVYRWFTIVIHFFFIVIMVFSAALYFLRKGNHNYILLCFELHDSIYLPLSTNSFAFLLLLFVLSGLLIFVTNTLIRNDYKLIEPFLNNLSMASTISLISYSIQFIIGVMYLRSSMTIIIDLVLSSISLLVLLFVYLTVKRKQYYKPKRIISESTYPSALFCLNCYIVLYLMFDLITRTPANLTQYTDLKFKLEITFNFIIFAIALIVLTIYKDIIFPLLLEIIEIGLIAKTKKNGATETVVTIFIILFLYVGVVFMIFKNRISLFRYKEDSEMIIVNYDKHHDTYTARNRKL